MIALLLLIQDGRLYVEGDVVEADVVVEDVVVGVTDEDGRANIRVSTILSALGRPGGEGFRLSFRRGGKPVEYRLDRPVAPDRPFEINLWTDLDTPVRVWEVRTISPQTGGGGGGPADSRGWSGEIIVVLAFLLVGIASVSWLIVRGRSGGRPFGHFRIRRLISDSGGMAILYEAKDTRNQRTVALKILRPQMARDASVRDLFMQEGPILRSLHADPEHPHPPIVRCFDHGEVREGSVAVPYISLELLPGRDLERILRERGRLGVREAVHVARQVAVGLQVTHANQVVYRDIAAQNIMVINEDFDVRLVDFGVAKEHGVGSDRGEVFGRPAYMSPEAIRGEPPDPRSDIYSIGVLLYVMLEGHPPFEDSDVAAVLKMHETQAPPPMQADVPQALRQLVLRMLEKRRERRPPAVRKVIEALDAMEEALG